MTRLRILFGLTGFVWLMVGAAKVAATEVKTLPSNVQDLEVASSDRNALPPIPAFTFNEADLQLAQLPNPIFPKPPELPDPTPPQPQPLPLQPIPPNPPNEVSPEIPGTIRVERFEFEGNTAFSEQPRKAFGYFTFGLAEGMGYAQLAVVTFFQLLQLIVEQN